MHTATAWAANTDKSPLNFFPEFPTLPQGPNRLKKTVIWGPVAVGILFLLILRHWCQSKSRKAGEWGEGDLGLRRL